MCVLGKGVVQPIQSEECSGYIGRLLGFRLTGGKLEMGLSPEALCFVLEQDAILCLVLV